ncbi:cadherin EGF LAG seven-pass G-type receptor 2-like [Ruditapes philippinarum]|uniref:cadherin EGF LAG seven-pass G-type receptor 2-like n=1 Tax=Ruditapes philippinarum TaxID=129788 RepID=UPI00295B2E13|nr:cadherin EGF LAG seven-pass G-type receptor 2-like [Ruditapes philippinarum]
MVVPFHVRVMFAVFAVIQSTTGQDPPTWNTGTSFTKTSSDCTEITDLSATSETGDTVLYSVESQTPNAGFTIGANFASDPILTCAAGSVSQSSYVVVVRAKYQSDQGQSDLTITITFTDQSPVTVKFCQNVGGKEVKWPLYIVKNNTDPTYLCVIYSNFIKDAFTLVSCLLYRANQDNNVPTDITLTITVTGLSAPVFVDPDPDSTKDGHKIYMCENIQNGDSVMTLNANDEDSDDSSLIFSMEGSSDDVKALFEIVGNTLKIKSTVADNTFDYEKEGSVKSYAIVLKVTDVSGLSSTLETSIELEDDNEFAPVFTSASEASISESSSPGATVIKLVASDQDGDPEFNKVSYSLSGDDASSFELSGSSKDEIIVKEGATFDYTTKSSYTLTVTASDSDPDESKTSDQELIIKLLTAPSFTSPINNDKIDVNEDSTDGYLVKTLEASDEDGGTLTYTIVSQTPDDPVMFAVQNNELKTKGTFNVDVADAVQSYTLSLKVSDGNDKTDDKNIQVVINIKDSNTQTPTFKTGVSYEASVKETAEIGFKVLTVTATDDDLTETNNKVTYSLVSVTEFIIGESSGEITVASPLSYNTKSSYDVTVTAKDNGGKSATQNVKITILTAPKFTSPINNDKIDVPEASADGSLVKTLVASDEDDDVPIYTIVSQTPDDPVKFAVQNNELKTKGTFNVDVADAVQSYTLSLKVSDGNDKTDDETIQVVINIKDSNTQFPKFKTGVSYEASVKETAEIGFKVLTVTATDDDLTETNNKVTYSLGSVTEFIIGESSGEITVASELSYNTKSSYDVTVTAKDNGGKSATQNVKITILTAPKFTSPINNDKIDVLEASADGSLVKTLEASDEDGDSPIYTIVSQTPDDPVKFVVENNELKTKGTFNVDVADAVQSYTLSLKVSDGNDKTDDETIQVEINIKDSNTQSPKFKTGVSYEASVQETAEIGLKVLTVTATDDDLTETNNKVTYSLGSVTEFKIGESSGEITVAAELNYDSKSSYEVTVTAKDNGDKSASQNVKITILAGISFIIFHLFFQSALKRKKHLS